MHKTSNYIRHLFFHELVTYYLDLYNSMHRILRTKLMKVNNDTWIYVKVCTKSQIKLWDWDIEVSWYMIILVFTSYICSLWGVVNRRVCIQIIWSALLSGHTLL